jgi:predicted nucleotidyltransferase
MLTTSLSAEMLDDLRRVFSKYPEVEAVYLFGSQATETTHSHSDIDLAIWPRSAAARESKLAILADLTRIGLDNISLIFLDTPNYLLRHQAVRLNQIVYQTDEFDAGSTYSLVVRQYLDFKPFLDVQRETYKEQMKRS